MASNPKTAARRLRVSAIVFALVAVLLFALAYDEHRIGERPNSAIAQGVAFLSLCVVFLSIAPLRERRVAQSGEENAPPESK
jgi:hypothetical protein